jgi:hypothetical protein
LEALGDFFLNGTPVTEDYMTRREQSQAEEWEPL